MDIFVLNTEEICPAYGWNGMETNTTHTHIQGAASVRSRHGWHAEAAQAWKELLDGVGGWGRGWGKGSHGMI